MLLLVLFILNPHCSAICFTYYILFLVRQSSAKSRTLEFTTDGKPLICKRKSNGIKSNGIPESTSANKDDLPFTITLCLRSFKKVEIQCFVDA